MRLAGFFFALVLAVVLAAPTVHCPDEDSCCADAKDAGCLTCLVCAVSLAFPEPVSDVSDPSFIPAAFPPIVEGFAVSPVVSKPFQPPRFS
ncbi:MAG: hypothetical protein PHV34_15975 [Verrucomicrobiae bacterium]|nr:hypothetical protein [Verrucomicrobiae bacterium]